MIAQNATPLPPGYPVGLLRGKPCYAFQNTDDHPWRFLTKSGLKGLRHHSRVGAEKGIREGAAQEGAYRSAAATMSGKSMVASPKTFTDFASGRILPQLTASSGRAPASLASNSCALLM